MPLPPEPPPPPPLPPRAIAGVTTNPTAITVAKAIAVFLRLNMTDIPYKKLESTWLEHRELKLAVFSFVRLYV
ncbi:hypothetical protein [Polaromonas sp. UBA4122]|uniref:hypothetical protein n=1 Tax=Polaromonas sp. UBA4122 TaxID=1947074 RepID=UPI0025E6A96E|nr:hypothetical protein [Polaromonas sp. UBA4122]